MPRPQFSLRALLVATTEIAIFCGYFAAVPRISAALGIFWGSAIGALLGGAVIASLSLVLNLLGFVPTMRPKRDILDRIMAVTIGPPEDSPAEEVVGNGR